MEDYYSTLNKKFIKPSRLDSIYMKLSENENAKLYLCYPLQLYKIYIHTARPGRNTKNYR